MIFTESKSIIKNKPGIISYKDVCLRLTHLFSHYLQSINSIDIILIHVQDILSLRLVQTFTASRLYSSV
ncbi:hypothetical protein SAMN04487825_11464 [Prevotella sp. kh1p2]|nr:hypothetical protein SAMN04487825_11464 [Prevotella sp. kh1p2]SNU11831.1 hypothetical protein SAMN06298210_11441 [Prevotellaceae bacterium KH2P17]